jgi:hypothetical protein
MPCPSALSVTRLLPATLGVFRKAYPLTTLNLFDMTPVEQYRALVNRLKERPASKPSSQICARR